jgi:hypothetical protein
MRKVIVRLIVAAVLVIAADAFNRAAAVETALASEQERLTTLRATTIATTETRVEEALGLAGRLPFVGERLLAEVRRQRAVTAYWTGDYGALLAPPAREGEPEVEDPALLQLSTDAAYRQLLLTVTERAALVRGLDDVLRGYGDVLKADPGRVDAAFNYEFVARLRDAISRGGRAAELTQTRTDMHGEAGEPPEGTKAPDFNVIVPMRPDERQDQFEAGSGSAPVRKG